MREHAWICVTCGVQREHAAQPPPQCPICEDERQYVGPQGQRWMEPAAVRATHSNLFHPEEPGLWSIRTDPVFAIGQRAYLIQTPSGNLLWDCVSLVDDDTIRRVKALGGIRSIAISHPHYYAALADWSEAFDGAPVLLHEADQSWVARRTRGLRFWSGERHPLFGGLSLIRTGGHFDGYQVAHWPGGALGAGVLFAGDQPQVCFDRRWVTFMYSYPNWIPFDAATVRRIADSLAAVPFDRLYGAFGRNIEAGAKEVLARSAVRYLRAISGDPAATA